MDKDTRGSVRVEQGAKRVRAYLGGRLVADTRTPFLVWEIPYYPAYYLPLAGVTVADSVRPHILYETHLPPRYYLPLPDVRTELLIPSDTSSHCPYKGTAGYWSVDAGHGIHPDLVWIYRTPLPESQKVAGLACFYNEKVDLYVDGELQDRPRSPFS